MRRRLLLSYLAVTLLVLALLEIPLGLTHAHNERQNLTARVERDAVALASLAEETLEAGARPSARLSEIAAAYSRDTGGRVVIVDRRGRAIVDTDSTPASREFSNRPEFARALSGEVASGVRGSRTLGGDLLYVAVPAASSGTVHGAVRITYPMSAVQARILRYWATLAAIAAVALVVASAVGLGFARWIARPLRSVEQAASAVAEGDLAGRAPVGGPPEVRRLAAAFNEMVAKLDTVLRSQEAFVADASHQLRTPLTALRLRLENLERGRGSGEPLAIERALGEVDRLSRLVDGLLALARADRSPAVPREVDVAEVAGGRVEAWAAAAGEQGVELVQRTPTTVPARATPGRLEQVLDNLLANALEVSPQGSSIVVSAERVDGWTEIHVVDEGPGMRPEQRGRAFDRFWRADHRGEGFGLGLAIVHRLVTSDGGTVELRDAPAGGLDAVVRLPAARARA
jgi:signal transduction histidine kinase